MKQHKLSSPMSTAYTVTAALAAEAIREWAINGLPGLDARDRDINRVYDALAKQQGEPDPNRVAHDAIDKHLGDAEGRLEASDAVTAVFAQASDAGYIYGLAVGLALEKGGGR